MSPTMYKDCAGRRDAPNRINGRRLVGHVGPALARQLAELREPIGEGLVLPPRNVFLKCSCHVVLLAFVTSVCYMTFEHIRNRTQHVNSRKK